MGYIGVSTSLGILLAPLLGGLVYAHSGYYAVFAMAFGLIAVDIVLRLTIIEKSAAAKFRVQENDNRTGARPIEPDSEAQQGIQLADLEDAIVPAPVIPLEPPRSATRRDSNAQATSESSPFKVLLTSRRFLTTLWGTTVQAILLTAFDSVRPPHLLSLTPTNNTPDSPTIYRPRLRLELPRCWRNHDSSSLPFSLLTTHRCHSGQTWHPSPRLSRFRLRPPHPYPPPFHYASHTNSNHTTLHSALLDRLLHHSYFRSADGGGLARSV